MGLQLQRDDELFTGKPDYQRDQNTKPLTEFVSSCSGWLAVNLSSSNASVATTPATVSFVANATSVIVPVTCVAAGSVTITASALNVTSATATV